MKRFSVPVDLRSRKEMTDFLQTHFRYDTMNSWNCATSYACNLKIPRLGLSHEIESKLYELLDTTEFFFLRQDLMDAFDEAHDFRWQVGMNGRSGGYLVLYEAGLNPPATFLTAAAVVKRTSKACQKVETAAESAVGQNGSTIPVHRCSHLRIQVAV